MKFIIKDSTLLAVKQDGDKQTRLVIPAGIEVIGYKACAMTHFEEIVIPDGVKKIGVEAFASCPYLKTVHIPASCEVIEEKCFYDCKGLENVYIATNNSLIRKNAFSVIDSQIYDNLELMFAPERPVYDTNGEFSLAFHVNCDASALFIQSILQTANVHTYHTYPDDIRYEPTLYGPHYKQSLRETPIKRRKCTILCESLRRRCLAPENFPEKQSRFTQLFGEYCCALTKGNPEKLVVSFLESNLPVQPAAVEEIYGRRLQQENSKTIGVSSIGGKGSTLYAPQMRLREASFVAGWTNRILEIPEGVVSIASCDYKEYAAAKEIILPETLMVIHANAFAGFDELERVRFKSKPLYISPDAFGETPFRYFAGEKLSQYYDRYVRERFFTETDDFETLDLNFVWGITRLFQERMQIVTADGVSYLLDQKLKAIALCTITAPDKTVLVIPETIAGVPVENIGSGCFAGLQNLERIELPASVKLVNWRAFAGCTALQSVVFHNDTHSVYLDSEIFHNCQALELVSFGMAPALPTQWRGDIRWTDWNYNSWRMHDRFGASYKQFSAMELLETRIFRPPFPKLHIAQLSQETIAQMRYRPDGLVREPYFPKYIVFEEGSREQSDKE